jgi:hypothetical protein
MFGENSARAPACTIDAVGTERDSTASFDSLVDPVDNMPAQQVESLGKNINWGWAAALASARRSSVADMEIAGKELSRPRGVFASIPRTKVSRPGSRKFRKD